MGIQGLSRENSLKEISQALSKAADPDFIEDFLKSLLTDNEVQEITTRWELVKLLDGGMSQRKISAELGLSLCKITRGSRELKKDKSAFKQMIDLYETEAGWS